MKALDEPPYLTVGTDVSAKYRGAFCEAKIKTAKRLVKVKVTFRHDSSTVEVQDDHIKGPLKVGAIVEVKNLDGAYQEAVINKLTDASWYTVVFDDGDEKTLRRSSLCLKGERHFAESETLDQLPLTNPEHFGTPVIGKKTNRGRRSNHIPEEESSSSSSDEDEDDRKQIDELLGKVVCVDYVSLDKKKALWFPALVVCPDCSDEIAVKKDNILVRSFKDGKFTSVPRKDVHEITSDSAPKPDAILKQAFDQALEFHKSRTIPANWKTELKEDSSSSEAEEEEEEEDDEKEKEDNSSEEEEEIEPFPEERENFLQQLYKFMEDRGTPINKRPVLGYRNLNLFKLFRLVHKLGGFDNIESGAVWKQVYQDLGIPVLNSAAGYNVKCAYKKYLYGFEEYCRSANIEFQMALPEKVVNKPCKECENVKEIKVKEENEPEIKEIKIEEEENIIPKEEKPTDDDTERKENIKPSLGSKKNLLESIPTQSDQEKEVNMKKTEENENLEDKDEETTGVDESLSIKVEAEEEKAKSGDETNKEEDEDDEEAEEEEEEEEEDDELKDEVQSQSSTSSEDYIIILPECFDTSRPLGDSMYSSALSQPGLERGAEGEPGVDAGERVAGGENQPQGQSINDILMTSQTLDTVPLTPEVVGPPPQLPRSPSCAQHDGSPGVDLPVTIPEASSVPDQIRGEPRGSSGIVNSRQKSYDHSRHHHHGSSIAGGLVKGALSVAASAYKALFAGPPVTAQPIVSEDQTAALMAHLFEMGFCDRQLNLRLLKKHNYNILQVVTELLQVNNNDWYSHRY